MKSEFFTPLLALGSALYFGEFFTTTQSKYYDPHPILQMRNLGHRGIK